MPFWQSYRAGARPRSSLRRSARRPGAAQVVADRDVSRAFKRRRVRYEGAAESSRPYRAHGGFARSDPLWVQKKMATAILSSPPPLGGRRRARGTVTGRLTSSGCSLRFLLRPPLSSSSSPSPPPTFRSTKAFYRAMLAERMRPPNRPHPERWHFDILHPLHRPHLLRRTFYE